MKNSKLILIISNFALYLSTQNLSAQEAAKKVAPKNPVAIKSESAKTTKLQQIIISDKLLKEDEGYHDGATYIGKNLQATKDIPQSLTTITRGLMDDRNADSLQSALRNVSGITFNTRESGYGRAGDNFSLRGVGTSGDFYLDGMRDNAQYFRDPFNLERVEVLKGSASMLFGRGSIGGIINQASKEADLNLESNVNFIVGSHDYFRETADVSKNISKNSAVRINIMKTDNKSNRDYVERDSFGVAPSLKFGIGTNDEYTVSFSHLSYEVTPDYGIPIPRFQDAKPISVANDTFYGLPNVDKQKDSTNIFTASWNHKFDNANSVKTIVRRSQVDRSMYGTRPASIIAGGNAGLISRQHQGKTAKENFATIQSNYNSKFKAFGIKHETLLGGEYIVEKSGLRFTNIDSGGLLTSQNNPNNFPNTEIATNIDNPNNFKSGNFGIYAQDIFAVAPKWKILLGGRYDDFRSDFSGTEIGGTPESERVKTADKIWSYRSGLMYQPTDYSTYYISRGTSFSPSGSVESAHPDRVKAAATSSTRKTITTEVGAKLEFLDGNLSVRSALFYTESPRANTTQSSQSTSSVSSGANHSEGIEFESTGKITNKWEIFGGITLLRTRIEVNPESSQTEGLGFSNAPKISGNLWNSYKINENWKIAGGADFMSFREGSSVPRNNSKAIVTKIPGYVRFDAMIGWYQKDYSVKLNIFNLLDKEYYDSIHLNGIHAVPGIDRSAQLGVSYKF